MSRAEYMRNYRKRQKGEPTPIPPEAILEAMGLRHEGVDVRHDIDSTQLRLQMLTQAVVDLTAERNALKDEVKDLKRRLVRKDTVTAAPDHVPEYGGALIAPKSTEWPAGFGSSRVPKRVPMAEMLADRTPAEVEHDRAAGFGHSRPAPKPTSAPKPKGRGR